MRSMYFTWEASLASPHHLLEPDRLLAPSYTVWDNEEDEGSEDYDRYTSILLQEGENILNSWTVDWTSRRRRKEWIWILQSITGYTSPPFLT